MTQREFYTEVTKSNVSDAIKEYAQTAIAKIDAKNQKRASEGSKTAKANAPIKEAIVASMQEGHTYTAAEIVALGIEGVTSTQKASALLRQIAEAKRVVVTEVPIKGKGKVKGYTLVVTAPEA